MADVTTPADFHQLELFLQAGNSLEALSLVTQRLQIDPANRQLQLFGLLTRVIAFGAEPAEAEIDRLRSLTDLSDLERAIITQILSHGLEAALRSGDAGKVWVYRRSLRRLAAGLPLDRPFLPLRLGRQTPAIDFTAMELATVRKVFLAETDEPRARAGATGRLTDTLKGSRRVVLLGSAGRKVADDLAAACAGVKCGWQNKLTAIRAAPIFATWLSRASMALIVSALMVVFGWSLMGGKSAHAPSGERAANKPQIALASQPGASALGAAASGRAADSKGAVTDGTSLPPGAGSDPTNTRSSAMKQGRAGMRAAPMLERGEKNPPAGERARVLHAVQSVGLRGEPRFGAAKEHSLASGARVVVIESRGSWLKVRSEASGSIGYVRKEFLVARSPAHR